MSMKSKFQQGDIVIRELEGIEYRAKIEKVYKSTKLQCLVANVIFLDDGNVEEEVPLDELLFPKTRDTGAVLSPTKSKRSDTLLRPLLGLVEDDYDVRNNMIPTVLLHENLNTDEAIILNGAENKLAAGGGFRALRYLKK